MLTELNQIEEASSEEKTALSFLTLLVGALLSSLLGIPAADASAMRWGIYAAVVGLCALGSIWFCVVWLRKRRSAARILEEVRKRAGAIQQSVALSSCGQSAGAARRRLES